MVFFNVDRQTFEELQEVLHILRYNFEQQPQLNKQDWALCSRFGLADGVIQDMGFAGH
jgi:hypothetical protein